MEAFVIVYVLATKDKQSIAYEKKIKIKNLLKMILANISLFKTSLLAFKLLLCMH